MKIVNSVLLFILIITFISCNYDKDIKQDNNKSNLRKDSTPSEEKYIDKTIDVYKIDSSFYPFLDTIIKYEKKCLYYHYSKTIFIYSKPIFQEVNCTKCPNIAIFSEFSSRYNFSNCFGVFEYKRHLFFCESICNKELIQKTSKRFHFKYFNIERKDILDDTRSAWYFEYKNKKNELTGSYICPSSLD